MYKRYVKKSPEFLVFEWDGKDETIEGINSWACSKHPGSHASRSERDSNTLTLTFNSIIGINHSYHAIGDYIVFNESEEMPYKRLIGCTKKYLDENFSLSAQDHLPEEMTKETLFSYKDHLTVGKLKKFLEKNEVPDTAPVVVQRIYDMYFQKHGWKSYLKEDEHTYYFRQRNKEIESGAEPDKFRKLSEEELKLTMSQYHPAFCCTSYKDDQEILFIDLHY